MIIPTNYTNCIMHLREIIAYIKRVYDVANGKPSNILKTIYLFIKSLYLFIEIVHLFIETLD